MLRRFAPLGLVLALIAFGARLFWLDVPLSYGTLFVVLGGAVIAAAVAGWRSAPRVDDRDPFASAVAAYAGIVLAALALVPDPRADIARIVPTAHLALIVSAMVAALAGGAALAQWRVGRELDVAPRLRLGLAALVLVAGVAGRASVGIAYADGVGWWIPIAGALALAMMTTVPVDGTELPRRGAFFVLGLAALFAATCAVEQGAHFFSGSFHLRSLRTLTMETARDDDAFARCMRADLGGMFPLALPAWVLAWRLGARRALRLASPLLLIAAVVVLAEALAHRTSEAAIGRYVAPVGDPTLDVARAAETVGWDDVEIPVQRAIVVRRGQPITAVDADAIARLVRSASAEPSILPPDLTVIGERDTTLGEIVRAVDPDATRSWHLLLVYEARPPLDPWSPLASAFPWVRAVVPVAHRVMGEAADLLARIEGGGEPVLLEDETTIAEIVEMEARERRRFRTMHPPARTERATE